MAVHAMQYHVHPCICYADASIYNSIAGVMVIKIAGKMKNMIFVRSMHVSHRVAVVRCYRPVPNAAARQHTMFVVFSKPVLQ